MRILLHVSLPYNRIFRIHALYMGILMLVVGLLLIQARFEDLSNAQAALPMRMFISSSRDALTVEPR